LFGNVYLQNTSEFPCGHLFSSQRFFFVFLSLIHSKGKINPKKLFKVQYTTPDLTVSIPLSFDLQPTGQKKKKPWYKQIQYLRTTKKKYQPLSLSLNGWIWETKILNSSSIQWKVITTATRSSLFMMKMGCVLCYGV
jgi:hypothetical protein